MKTRRLALVLILVLAVIISVGSCATKRRAISDEDLFKAWSGTWINTEYSGLYLRFQKRINYPDGTYEWYRWLLKTTINVKGKSTITDTWIDSKGDILYKAHYESYTAGYEMGKISDSGNIFELLFSTDDYPIEEWKPDYYRYTYWIYYRQ